MRSRDRIATRTDQALAAPISGAVDRGSYRIRRTPGRPNYHGGNCLLLDHPPAAGQLDHPPAAGQLDSWWQICRRAFADIAIEKLRLEWETGTRAEGGMWPDSAHMLAPVEYTCLVVLQLDEPPPPRAMPPGISVRPLTTDSDWQALTELSIACFAGGVPAYAEFIRWHLGVHRDNTRAPGESLHGVFFGAWDGDTLAGAVGLYRTPHALRFQEVQTHAGYRRRGICSGLCTHALTRVWDPGRDRRAVIVGAMGEPAVSVYRGLGFAEVGLQHELTAPLS